MNEKIQKGIANPAKIPPYVLNKLSGGRSWRYKAKSTYRNACIFQDGDLEDFDYCSRDEEYKNIIESDVVNLSEHHRKNFNTYLSLPTFADAAGCNSILEIGAGLSTGIWAYYAEKTGSNVTSIDINRENIQKYYENT
jgi:2-polyprenyl-3-methyl-5-hydroxy-6-metoxy-1,4-benzoquinol methylase